MKKIVKISIFIGFIIATLISGVKAEDTSDAEDRYMIFIEHSYPEKNDEYRSFINGIISEINDLIVSKRNTYKNQDYLNKLEEDFNKSKDDEGYILNYGNSPFVYPISNIGGTTVLFSYLTPEIVTKVKTMENVKSIERDQTVSIANNNVSTNSGSKPSSTVDAATTTTVNQNATASPSGAAQPANAAVSAGSPRIHSPLGNFIKMMMP